MSKTQTETIRARLRDPNHPTGKRNRAGLQFTTDVQEYEVTPEQFALIESDPAIHIMGNRAVEEDPTDDEETGQTGTNQTPDTTTTPPATGDENKDPEEKAENLERATKGRLIEILIQELKQDPTKDFDPEATNDKLRTLIVTLREANKAE